jgi:rfaE bifunctional protein nucleotidyltransferase chain/domain
MRLWTDKTIRDLASWREGMDKLIGHQLILTNGCFDLLHVGHVQLLQTMKLSGRNGTTLVVAVNSDASVRQLKGPTRPLVPQEQRLAVIAALESVDYCFIFEEKRCDRILRLVRPNIWAKGGDYTLSSLDPGERAAAEEVGAEIKIIPYTHGISTSEIISRTQATTVSG